MSDLTDWNLELAQKIALSENIILTKEHILVIEVMRAHFFKFGISPGMRPLVQALKDNYGAEKGTSAYLHKLFPGGPSKQGCKIAGLPPPTRCI